MYRSSLAKSRLGQRSAGVFASQCFGSHVLYQAGGFLSWGGSACSSLTGLGGCFLAKHEEVLDSVEEKNPSEVTQPLWEAFLLHKKEKQGERFQKSGSARRGRSVL